MSKERITINILPEVKKKMEEESRKNNISIGNIGGKIIEDYFLGNKEKDKINEFIIYLERILYLNLMEFEILKEGKENKLQENHKKTLESLKEFKEKVKKFS